MKKNKTATSALTFLMPRCYRIRSNGALLLPPEILAILGWKRGQKCIFFIDEGRLIVTSSEGNQEE